MPSISPYLTFNGNCEAAFKLYHSVFGGTYNQFSRFKEMPVTTEGGLTEADAERIMHVSLPISLEITLMGSDITEAYSSSFVMGTNVSLSINTNSKEEADRLFKGLSDGGVITMPLADTFWGAYFGMFTDKFGVHWMINYDSKPA